MATLLELTAQGDVGTITDESKLSQVTLMTPQQLYELWERQPWAAHAIDFEQDRIDWASVPPEDKADLAYNFAAFFVGEERVTTQFSGLVRAYETQGEEAFLATQQVDEARHAQHFNNFFEQVLGIDGTFEDRLVRARDDLNPAFIDLFDGYLVEAQDRLLADPSDIEAKVDFVTTYHMIIEGTLALTGQYFLTDFCEKRGILPGFTDGFRKISQDEHRHVAYGTWFLKEKAKDPALKERITAKLQELIPIAGGVLVPPSAKDPFNYTLLGYNSTETNTFAFNALSRRLKVIGVPLFAEDAGAVA